MTSDKAGTWSPWALVALACSVGLCPAVTMLGVVFGLIAVRDVKLRARRGLRVAIAAIVIALLVTPLTTILLMWWNNSVREPMLHGPVAGLQAAQDGDVRPLLGQFEEGEASAKEASDFVRQMTARFGTLDSISQDPDREAVWSPDGWSISVPYVLKFSREIVKGEGYFVILRMDGGQREPVFRFSWIRIGKNPSLFFPESARESVESGTEGRDGNQG
ncbi:MAG: hypothetical protein CMJ40_10770 [Phycisphaerae bacterium]|nr:hypothetical protein [Phycisphaerae bacterium]